MHDDADECVWELCMLTDTLLLSVWLFVTVSAIVEFDYAANETDELHLVKGAIITNIKVQHGGWWYGTIASSGRSGMFPDNFVKLLDQHHEDKVILR